MKNDLDSFMCVMQPAGYASIDAQLEKKSATHLHFVFFFHIHHHLLIFCNFFHQINHVFYRKNTVPCTSRANCARHMHHLLSVPILTIENYFHSQVTAFFMRTKKVLNSVSQKSRIDEIFIIIAKRLTKHKVKWQH